MSSYQTEILTGKNPYGSQQFSPRIFERDYVEGVLGIQLPLNESAPYSAQYRQQIIEEQLQLEGFFGDFKKLGGQMKDAALGLRYIFEEPSRIKEFVQLVIAGINETYDKFMNWAGKLLSLIKKLLKKQANKVMQSIGEFIEKIRDGIKKVWEKTDSLDGWKKALFAIFAACSIRYVWDQITESGADQQTDEEKAAEIMAALGATDEEIAKLGEVYAPSLVAALYYTDTDDRLDEFLGKLKDKAKKAMGGKDDKKEESTKGKKEVDEFLDPLKALVKKMGKKFAASIAVDAALGALTGGIATAFKFMAKVFKSIKFVFKVVGDPISKFVGQIKDQEAAEKEAAAGKEDPTDPETQKESYLRAYVRQILAEQEELPAEEEQVLPQDEWVLLQPGDPRREKIQDDLYDMVQTTYADIGGHFKIQNAGDLDRYSYWVVKDIDDEPDADVAILGKPDIGGVKMGGAANDGTPAAAAEYKEKSAELRGGGNVDGVGNWWGEVSGKPAYAMIKRGAPAVEDEATARRLMDGDDFVWHGAHPDPNAPAMFKSVNGWYTKKFGSKESTKIILGSPS